MPKLWNETIDAHRREVRAAILESAAGLVAEHGLLNVTMSRIAEHAGIGRATLYKYFPGVEEILVAWHERQVAGHLEELARIAGREADAGARLEAMLEAYAAVQRERAHHAHHGPHAGELVAFVHRDAHVASAEQRLHELIRGLLAEAAQTGDVREDVAPTELATYCLRALDAAGDAPSAAAARRLVTLVLTGLRPPVG